MNETYRRLRASTHGIETMRMIQKGQICVTGKDVVKQNQFVCSLFGMAT